MSFPLVEGSTGSNMMISCAARISDGTAGFESLNQIISAEPLSAQGAFVKRPFHLLIYLSVISLPQTKVKWFKKIFP